MDGLTPAQVAWLDQVHAGATGGLDVVIESARKNLGHRDNTDATVLLACALSEKYDAGTVATLASLAIVRLMRLADGEVTS